MTKPRLAKVRALFYVLQQLIKRSCAYFDTASTNLSQYNAMRRFPLVRQHDLMQCGAACLAMICRFHGKYIGLRDTENLCTPGKRGVSMQRVKEGAEVLDFNTNALRCDVRMLNENSTPCILYWENRHFVVLFKITKNKYHIADPAKGIKTYDKNSFIKAWTGDGGTGLMLLLTPSVCFKKNKGQNGTKRSLGIIKRYIKNYRSYLSVVVIGLLLSCVLQLLMPVLTQNIVDVGIRYKSIHFIWLILLGELVVTIGKTATEFIRSWILTHVSTRINISLVSDFFTKLLRLPMSFFDIKHMGDLTQRMTDHNRIQSFMAKQVLGIIFTILSFIVFGSALALYNRKIFIVFIVFTVCYALWISLFLSKRRELDMDYFEKASENQNITFEFLTTLQETKLQNCCNRRKNAWEKIQEKLFTLQLKSLKLQQVQEAGSAFINEAKNIIITVLSATAVIDETITLGTMLAIQYIIGQLNSPISQLVSFVLALQDMRLSVDRINEVYSREDEDGYNSIIPCSEIRQRISISHLYFRYDGMRSDRFILSDVSFDIEAGKVTAIVGASGCGKTSLIKILLGYYSYEGSIKIGGLELRKIHKMEWRKRCGVVMQDGAIFSESIGRNIAVSDAPIDTKRLDFAAKSACIYDFIQNLPQKYETVIGRCGIGISQGQKQRILVARAIYRNPDFIFLDEATNSLDTENERKIVNNLKRFYNDKTVLIVAHRLSTVIDADNIIVMDQGKIIETGTHDSLIKNKGRYLELIRNQL